MKIIIVESPTKIPGVQKYAGDNYFVCASKGQIVELAKGGRFGIGVNPLKSFKPFYHLMEDKIDFLDKIISKSDKIEQIIVATDPDTEGHGIAWHISEHLKHLGKPIVRAEFSEITEQGINDGLSNLTPIDINKFKAQETRRILDRIVGFMVSPFLINYYGANLSAGRVQSVATKLIIDREKEINEFIPKEYWNIFTNLTNGKDNFIVKYNGKILNNDEALEIKKIIESPNINESLFKVTKVKRTTKKEYPDSPFNTVKLQQHMVSKGIGGEETMKIAQELYEKGFISYMRTDSVRIADVAMESVRKWIGSNGFEVPAKPNIYKNEDAAQDAHECIRPTNVSFIFDKIGLSDPQAQVYRAIWTNFVASQMNPAVYDTADIKIEHQEFGKKFKITGKILMESGYLELSDKPKMSNGELPNLNEGDILKLVDDNSVIFEQKFTQPKSRYNESTFLEELYVRGIGRPGTYQEILSKITTRNYVEKHGKVYHGTKIGSEVTDLLSKYFEFMQYDYTASLEKEMDEIAIGTKNSLNVLINFYKSFIDKLKNIQIMTGGKICEYCNSPIYTRNDKNGNSYSICALYPFCSDKVKKMHNIENFSNA